MKDSQLWFDAEKGELGLTIDNETLIVDQFVLFNNRKYVRTLKLQEQVQVIKMLVKNLALDKPSTRVLPASPSVAGHVDIISKAYGQADTLHNFAVGHLVIDKSTPKDEIWCHHNNTLVRKFKIVQEG